MNWIGLDVHKGLQVEILILDYYRHDLCIPKNILMSIKYKIKNKQAGRFSFTFESLSLPPIISTALLLLITFPGISIAVILGSCKEYFFAISFELSIFDVYC